MSLHHLVRVGALGHVGRFRSAEAAVHPRGARVVVRTARGLELGEVVAPPEPDLARALSDGTILRGMTPEDQLLETRLRKDRDAAFAACAQRLAELAIPAALVDVEHLFDGRGLYFYFLGEVPPEVEAVTAELAELYDTQVQFTRFAETLATGCGPDCGQGDGQGAGCTNCQTGCAIAEACHAPRP